VSKTEPKFEIKSNTSGKQCPYCRNVPVGFRMRDVGFGGEGKAIFSCQVCAGIYLRMPDGELVRARKQDVKADIRPIIEKMHDKVVEEQGLWG
jgi:hypothetical protein